ncbi:MAG TPA: hypothetical protein VH134_15395 [Candidatus Dormibacteraeota bacterium]|jgi:hypothetical protein|nr:hypothetical protein [Candidatus Dormibacteraeota bacterium]
MQDHARHSAATAAPGARIRARAEGWGLLRPYLDAVGAIAAVLALMSSADLDSPIPYLCAAAVVVATVGSELAR